MLLASREFSPSGARCLNISSMSLFSRGERAEMNASPVDTDPREKPKPVIVNAFCRKSVVSSRAHIRIVLSVGRIAQISPAVVRPITVPMIDLDRIDAGHELKNNPMCSISNAVEQSASIPRVVNVAKYRASILRVPRLLSLPRRALLGTTEVLNRTDAPSKLAAGWIIIEALAQILLRRQWMRHFILRSGSVCHAI